MKRKFPKIIYFLVCFLLIFEQSGFAQVAGQLDISGYFSGLSSSLSLDKFRPLHLRYLSYDNLNNSFNLLLDKGDSKDLKEANLKDSTKELLNYFFTGITLANESFWVNLRPDSPDNMIDPYLAQTDLGKILLEADLQLKKDTASFTSPQTRGGKEYWDKLYKKAGELFGSENITIPTLTRPWIVPDEIIIRESVNNAYIYKATLKVMLEQDYLKGSAVYNFQDERLRQLNEYSSQLIRETIIPKLIKDVNTAKRYAPLRQAYYSLILAQWFKQKFYGKGGFYSFLINKNNLTGLTSKEAWSKTTYFQAYQKSFKEGEYNIKEQVYSLGSPTIRSYMSGGIAWQDINKVSSPILGTEKRNPFNNKMGKNLIVAALVAGAITFPSSNNAAVAASFDTAANTAQISAPATSAKLALNRIPIPIISASLRESGISISAEDLNWSVNNATGEGVMSLIKESYRFLRDKGIYTGEEFEVLLLPGQDTPGKIIKIKVGDLEKEIIVIGLNRFVGLDKITTQIALRIEIAKAPVLKSNLFPLAAKAEEARIISEVMRASGQDGYYEWFKVYKVIKSALDNNEAISRLLNLDNLEIVGNIEITDGQFYSLTFEGKAGGKIYNPIFYVQLVADSSYPDGLKASFLGDGKAKDIKGEKRESIKSDLARELREFLSGRSRMIFAASSSPITSEPASSPVSVSRRDFLKTAAVAAVVVPLVTPSIVNAAEKAAVNAALNYLASFGTDAIKIITSGNRAWDNYFNEYEILPGGSVKAETLSMDQVRIIGSKAKMLVNEAIDFTGLEIRGDFEVIAEVYSREGYGRYLRLQKIVLSGENSGIYYANFKAEPVNGKKLSIIFNPHLVAPVMSAKELKDSLKVQSEALASTEESLRKAREFNNIPENRKPPRYNLQGEQLFIGFTYKQSTYNNEVWVEREDLQAYINFLTHKINGHKNNIASLQKNLDETYDSLRLVNTIKEEGSGILVLSEILDGRPKGYNGQGPFYLNGEILRLGEVKGVKEMNNLKPSYEYLDISKVIEEVFPVRFLSLFQDLNLRKAAKSLQEEKLFKTYPANVSEGTVFAACEPEESKMSKIYDKYVNLFGTHKQYLQQLYEFALTNPVFNHLLKSTAGMDLDNIDKDGVPLSFKGKPFTNLDRSFEKANQSNTFLFYMPKGGFYYPLFSSQRQMLNVALRLANSERNIEVIESLRKAQKQGNLYEVAAEYLRNTIIRQMAHEFVHFLQDQKISAGQLQVTIQGLKSRFPDLTERINQRYGMQSYISGIFGGLSGDKLNIIAKEMMAFLIAELASDRPGFLLSDKNEEYIRQVINFLQEQKLLPDNFKLPTGYFNKAGSPIVVGFECSNMNTLIVASSALAAASPVMQNYEIELKQQLQTVIQGLGLKSETQPILDAEQLLNQIINGDKKYDGYDQNEYVAWHGYTHAVNNTIEAIKAMVKLIKENPSIPDRAVMLTAIAGILHDTGYYIKDKNFGTIKVQHERESEAVVRRYASQLSLSDRDVALISLIISATQADIAPEFWKIEKIENIIEGKGTQEEKDYLVKLLEFGKITGIDVNNLNDIYLVLGVIYGAKILAALDIWDTRADAVDKIGDLRSEFKEDEARLMRYLKINDVAELIDIKAKSKDTEFLNTKAAEKGIPADKFKAAVTEINKLVIKNSDSEQIAGTEDFYKWFADKRVAGLLGDGWDKLISPEAKARMTFTRGMVREANKRLSENGAISPDDIEGIKEQVAREQGVQVSSSSAASPVVLGSRFDGQHGWVSKPEYLSWLQKIKELIRTKIGSATPIRVYYYGMGGGRSLNTGGVEPIDVISPLLATDFDQLYSYDYSEAVSLPVFKAVLNRQLSDLGIQDSDVRLEKIGNAFQFSFPYEGRQRTVIVTYGKDAKNEFPPELLSGFEVLYSRGIPVVFRDMQAATKTALLEQLKKQAGFLVMESFIDAPTGIEGFSRVDMGDTSWSGEARRLDVFQAPGTPSLSIEPASSPVSTINVLRGYNQLLPKGRTETLKADLNVCLLVVAMDKDGNRFMAHFLPSGHIQGGLSNPDLVKQYFETYLNRMLQDMPSNNVKVAIISSTKDDNLKGLLAELEKNGPAPYLITLEGIEGFLKKRNIDVPLEQKDDKEYMKTVTFDQEGNVKIVYLDTKEADKERIIQLTEVSSASSKVKENKPQPRVEPKEDIGTISLNNGDKLSMRKGQEENIVSVAFYNKEGEQIGFVDILLRENLLNYIYINPNFRSKDYSKVILDAILEKLQDQSFTGRQFTFVSAYVQNPLVVNSLLEKGFILNPAPMPTEQSLMTKATLSRSRQIEGKIPLYIEDITKKNTFKDTLGNEGFEIVDKPIEGETYTVIINAKYTLYFEEKSGETQANSASPVYNEEQKTGGIDFRAMPITTQPVNPITNLRDSPLRGQSLSNINLDESWSQIQNMLKAEIIPSSERIKEYLQACCEKKDMDQEIDKVLACIADIFRLQEERVAGTDLSLKEMLTLLESDKPANEMQLVLAKITVQAKEPKALEQ